MLPCVHVYGKTFKIKYFESEMHIRWIMYIQIARNVQHAQISKHIYKNEKHEETWKIIINIHKLK